MNYIARPSLKPGLPAETHKTYQIPIQFDPKKKHVLINQDWNFPLTYSKTNIKDWKYKEPTEEDRKKKYQYRRRHHSFKRRTANLENNSRSRRIIPRSRHRSKQENSYNNQIKNIKPGIDQDADSAQRIDFYSIKITENEKKNDPQKCYHTRGKNR